MLGTSLKSNGKRSTGTMRGHFWPTHEYLVMFSSVQSFSHVWPCHEQLSSVWWVPTSRVRIKFWWAKHFLPSSKVVTPFSHQRTHQSDSQFVFYENILWTFFLNANMVLSLISIVSSHFIFMRILIDKFLYFTVMITWQEHTKKFKAFLASF